MNDLTKYLCPSCGYKFTSALYNEDKEFEATDEICPSCGYQYGYTDINSGFSFKDWRHQWVSNGMPFEHQIANSGPNWDPIEQLKRIGVELDLNHNIIKEPDDPTWHLSWVQK
jgi:DNA-directed RNA polymerase subunit RPC12/RpoP